MNWAGGIGIARLCGEGGWVFGDKRVDCGREGSQFCPV